MATSDGPDRTPPTNTGNLPPQTELLPLRKIQNLAEQLLPEKTRMQTGRRRQGIIPPDTAAPLARQIGRELKTAASP